MTDKQLAVYQQILSSTELDNRKVFLSAPGGTEKTCLINQLLAKVKSNSNFALAANLQGLLLHYLR